MNKEGSNFRAFAGLRLVIATVAALFLVALFTASAMMKAGREPKQALTQALENRASTVSKNIVPREKLNHSTASASLPLSTGPLTVTATAGTLGPTDYLTLKDAFDAINAGTHQGTIGISVLGDTTE